jgi:hypothetical protein
MKTETNSIMTIDDYIREAKGHEFIEFPGVIFGNETLLKDFVDFEKADLQLRIYLCEMIICRCFTTPAGIVFPADSEWFISNFFLTYKTDLIKPWVTSAIKDAVEMILSDDTFSKNIIGTTFMFGIVEFYTKHLLGYRPLEMDFFDERHKEYRKMTIGKAITSLKESDTDIGKSLLRIDKHIENRLKETEIIERRWVKYKIADRLSIARNTMLHGEKHSFYDKGELLALLYILYFLYDTKKQINETVCP